MYRIQKYVRTLSVATVYCTVLLYVHILMYKDRTQIPLYLYIITTARVCSTSTNANSELLIPTITPLRSSHYKSLHTHLPRRYMDMNPLVFSIETL